jgi:acetoin utilization deacetylase AcuC-like enzyme
MREGPALFFHPRCLDHTNGPGHPERPERLEAVRSLLSESFPEWPLHGGRDARREELALVHDAVYIDRLQGLREGGQRMLDPDTGFGPGSLDAALRGAGMAVDAALRLRGGEISLPFVFPRPPGHHAEANRAMGFCLFNNVAIAARALQEAYSGARVAIVDYDVHHGNGTQWAFYDDPSVLYVSLHQSPLFPGTGRVSETGNRTGKGFTVNLPMAGGKKDPDYLLGIDALVLPILREFGPDTLILSAGFDAHQGDPLAGMGLSAAGYAGITERLVSFAETACPGGLLHVLEGGYNLEALKNSVKNVLEVLRRHLDSEAPDAGQTLGPGQNLGPGSAFRELDEALSVQREFWSSV